MGETKMSVLTFVLEDELKRVSLTNMTTMFIINPATGRNAAPIRVYAPIGTSAHIVRAYMEDGKPVELSSVPFIPAGKSVVFEPGTLQLAAPHPIDAAELACLAEDLHNAAVDACLGCADMWKLITAALGRSITGERTSYFRGFSLGQASDILASDYYMYPDRTPDARFQAAAKTVLKWLAQS
jgi:hypothetical protein